MSTQLATYLTPEEYLVLERQAETRSEFLDGQVLARATSNERHNLITVNVLAWLHGQLKGQACEVYASAMRLKVSPMDSYMYPDVVVVCGEPQLEDEYADTLLNPTVIVEVLSKSTEDYDRGLKFEHYRKLESLREYLLVAQEKCLVEHFVRQPDNQWLLSETDNLDDTVQLPSINCVLAVSDIYDRVETAGGRAP
jgi:Uma2 family endonuclease